MKKKILKEAAPPEIGPEDSIDNQILAFFTKAERAAIRDGKARNAIQSTGIEESFKKMNLRFLLEAEEDEEEDDFSPKINIETFASEVNRLIEHFTNLVDTKGTIIKMAKNYLKNAHGDEEVEEFQSNMEKQYNKSESPKQDEIPTDNFAVGARNATNA